MNIYCGAMRVHLVDGTFELFRAHFSRRPGHRAAGRDAKATVGLAASLLGLLHDEREAATHVAVAFDNPIRSFRNDLWPGYKTEAGVPPELLAQLDAAEEATRALGVTVWSMGEFEADDALATAAARFRDTVDQVRILSPDKDMGQCLSGRRVVMVDRVRGREIDEGALLARRGIRPESVPDYLALVGDDADGIPGLPGFGEKTASALLGEHLHLEHIPRDPARWPAGIRGAAQLAGALRSGWEAAVLYRRLATLVRDVPLRESLADLRWEGSRGRASRPGVASSTQGRWSRCSRRGGPGGPGDGWRSRRSGRGRRRASNTASLPRETTSPKPNRRRRPARPDSKGASRYLSGTRCPGSRRPGCPMGQAPRYHRR